MGSSEGRDDQQEKPTQEKSTQENPKDENDQDNEKNHDKQVENKTENNHHEHSSKPQDNHGIQEQENQQIENTQQEYKREDNEEGKAEEDNEEEREHEVIEGDTITEQRKMSIDIERINQDHLDIEEMKNDSRTQAITPLDQIDPQLDHSSTHDEDVQELEEVMDFNPLNIRLQTLLLKEMIKEQEIQEAIESQQQKTEEHMDIDAALHHDQHEKQHQEHMQHHMEHHNMTPKLELLDNKEETGQQEYTRVELEEVASPRHGVLTPKNISTTHEETTSTQTRHSKSYNINQLMGQYRKSMRLPQISSGFFKSEHKSQKARDSISNNMRFSIANIDVEGLFPRIEDPEEKVGKPGTPRRGTPRTPVGGTPKGGSSKGKFTAGDKSIEESQDQLTPPNEHVSKVKKIKHGLTNLLTAPPLRKSGQHLSGMSNSIFSAFNLTAPGIVEAQQKQRVLIENSMNKLKRQVSNRHDRVRKALNRTGQRFQTRYSDLGERSGKLKTKLIQLLFNEYFELRKPIVFSVIFAMIVTYILTGSLIMSQVEGWSFGDGFYFMIVMLSTVGYGDIVPVTDAGRILTMVYILLGVIFMSTALGLVYSYILDRFEIFAKYGQDKATKWRKNRLMKFAYEVLVVSKVGLAFVLMFLTIALGTAVFHFTDNMTILESAYFSVVSMSTVGFGDLNVSGSGAKVFNVFYILIGTGVLAICISSLANAFIGSYRQRVANRVIHYKFDMKTLEENNRNKDGKITEQEFVEFVLLRLKKTSLEELAQIKRQFKALDYGDNHMITDSDIRQFEDNLHSTHQGMDVAADH